MTGPILDTQVNQAYFAWRPDGGLSLVVSSFFDPTDKEKWSYRLRTHVRIYPVPGTPLPSAGFSYLLFDDGSAAWIRRATAGATEGRNNSWVLIGRVDVLDFQAAIGLSLRPGWPDEPPPSGQSSPVPADKVRAATGFTKDLLSSVRDYQDDVEFVLAGLLADPVAELSVIGGVEPERLAIVWALQRVAEKYLPQRFRDRSDWSFSTYEDRHDTGAGELPGIVFLPARQQGAGAINRTIVDLAQPHVDPADHAQARRVVHYLVHNLQPDESLGDLPFARPQPETPPVPRQPEAVAPAPAERSPLADLLEAQHLGGFMRELRRLEETVLPHRTVLFPRAGLPTIDKLTEFVEVNARVELLHRLLRLLYGHDVEMGLVDAKAERHAAKLIKQGQSDQLARMLGAAAPPGTRSRDAAFARWADVGRLPAETAGQLSEQLRAARRSKWFPWVAAGAAVLAAAVVFLLGYLFGRPDNPAAAVSPTASPTAVTKPTTTTVKPPTEATQAPPPTAQDNPPTGQGQNAGAQPSIQVRADQGGTAWVFLRASNDQFVLLSACQPPSGNDWTCTRQPGVNGEQVAMAIPAGTDLNGQINQQMPRGGGWGKPQKIS